MSIEGSTKRETLESEFEKPNATTLRRAVKDDPRERIELEIGDEKKSEAFPQAKIKKWDNEVNFSIRRDNGARSWKEQDGMIVFESPDEDVRFYELDGFEDGGLEVELLLKKKPKTNVFDFTIETKGLNFFYQPELTKEEIDEGAERPEHVIGSYAVYHKTKKNNRVGGKFYKTGKAAHIYRPHVVDADGNETWAELNVDTETSILRVTIPQEFLDKAVYPVIVDPTLGYDTAGGSSDQQNGDYTFLSDTASAGGGITSMHATVYNWGGSSETGGGALYEGSSYVEKTVTETLPTSKQWLTLDFPTILNITSSTTYQLAFAHTAGLGAYCYYDAAGSSVGGEGSGGSPPSSWPSAIGSPSQSRNYSFYATIETITPTVSTDSASDISETSATLNGEIEATGGDTVTKRGFLYDTSSRTKPDAGSELDSESFETGGPGDPGIVWNSSGHSGWVRNSGGTNSGSTGPSSAQDGTYYVYVETSSADSFDSGDTDYLTYDFGSTKNGSVNFYYHQYGADQGTISLEGYDGSTWTTIWSSTGDQGNQWNNVGEASTSFTGYSQIRFKNVAAGGFTGDVALDNIVVKETNTPADTDYTSNIEETGTYSTGTYSIGATSLTADTTYYVRAYAYNSVGYSYADTEVFFTTTTAGTMVGIKIGGTFVDKPMKFKQDGSFR